MDATKTAVAAIIAIWLAASLTGCATPGGEATLDARAPALHPKVPVANSTFHFTTPQFGGSDRERKTEANTTHSNKAQPDAQLPKQLGDVLTDANVTNVMTGIEIDKLGLGLFSSVNLGMGGKMGRHTITFDDFLHIANGMTKEEVYALLYREPDSVVLLGGTLGGELCHWFEDTPTIFVFVVEFDVGGRVDRKSYSSYRR